MTPQETDLDLPMNVQKSLVEAWVDRGLPQGWGTGSSGRCSMLAYVLLEKVVSTPTIVGLWAKL